MADGKFVPALGKVAYYLSLPATNDGIVAVLLKTVEADDTLNNYATLATLLAGARSHATSQTFRWLQRLALLPAKQ